MWILISSERHLQSLPQGKVNQSHLKVVTDRSVLPRIWHLRCDRACLVSHLILHWGFNTAQVFSCSKDLCMVGKHTLSHTTFSLGGLRALLHGDSRALPLLCVCLHPYHLPCFPSSFCSFVSCHSLSRDKIHIADTFTPTHTYIDTNKQTQTHAHTCACVRLVWMHDLTHVGH